MLMLHAIVFNPRQSDVASFFYATVVVIGALLILHWLVWQAQPSDTPRHRRGLWSVVIGADNRWSTSKVQITLWTVTVIWGLAVLIFRISGDDTQTFQDAFKIEGEYLILVGFPATAGLVAKVLTMSRVDQDENWKPPADEPKLSDIVSNDQGTADLGDWQYFLFNLVALAAFYSLFISSPEKGLPSLPETLFALTGASAAIYVAKKATER